MGSRARHMVAAILLLVLIVVFGVMLARMVSWGNGENGDSESLSELLPPNPVVLPPKLKAQREQAIREMDRRVVPTSRRAFRQRARVLRSWRPFIDRFARAARINPILIEAIIASESHGDPGATSRAGARGLMQLIDSTARAHGKRCGLTHPARESYDPEKNICTGVRYFRTLLDRHHGDVDTALAEYNGGSERLDGAFDRLTHGSPRSFWAVRAELPKETRAYVPIVLAWEAALLEHAGTGRRLPGRATSSEFASSDDASPPTSGGPDRFAATHQTGSGVSTVPCDAPPERIPGATVWYTVRPRDRLWSFFSAFHPSREEVHAIFALNPYRWSSNCDGGVFVLPPNRYAFVMADGSTSPHAIAEQHGMTYAQLMRASGFWTDEDAFTWTFIARCAPPYRPNGCSEEHEPAPRGTRYLVRIR